MAKLRNTFLKSKMNKDLDSRLVPSGEYRDALNITVGKSESSSIGTAQNVLGNSSTGLPVYKGLDILECIGYIKDDSRNIVILFQTNYEDPSETQITPAPGSSICKITLIDFSGSTPVESTLVEGEWLNLAYNNKYSITGVNLVEDLLFWTDDRNQPRKININTALSNSNYYKYEHQISVAKYAPIEPIQLFNKVETRTNGAVSSSSTVVLDSVDGIEIGMFIVSNVNPLIEGSQYAQVVAIDGATNTVTLASGENPFPGVSLNDNQSVVFLSSTMTDKSSDPTWPGDPDYLEGRYVRFSYRIRYDDNEYSTFAPFTQICFIPKQKGYLINGDEKSAFRSTILDWFENNVNNIELLISLPTTGNNIISDYSISEIDILYKESESLIVSVLETIKASDIQASTPDTNIFSYSYKSEKPYRTLPEAQTIRVYDKVPVRARSQEVSGNRVIYGNYRDAWTAPSSINYNTSVQSKTTQFTNFIEYPNHTLKQNRNYQVGFILADKYNRQTSVILSSNDTGTQSGSIFFGGSTIYSPYTAEGLNVRDWFGNALRVLVNSPISVSNNTTAGTPGLYANEIDNGFAITDTVTITSTTYTFNLDPAFPNINDVPTIGSYLRGQYTDYIEVSNVTGTGSGPYVVTTSEQVNDIYRFDQVNSQPGVPNTKFAYNINPLGWYSYKVVVKQQEQQYYNSYLPGMLNAYPDSQTSDSSVKYVQAVFGFANAPTTSSDIISIDAPPNPEEIIIGMSVTNNTTAFANAQSVLVSEISGVGTPTLTITVNQQVNVAVSDSLSFLGSAELIEHGVNTSSFPVDEEDKTSHVVLINDNINKIPRDLSEVGPDQKQYRSSVELFGRVENFGQSETVPLSPASTPIIPLSVSVKTSTITYDASVAEGQKITKYKPGDSIQAENGGPSSGSTVYPKAWLKDTVIVSNIVDPITNVGTITFSPPQVIYGTASSNETDTFSFLREENRQYFPERKPDTVNTISTARDLDFLPNSIDNIRGTAALNFYQLDSNPLVARISTVKGIGATAQEMIPFLSVYETKPVESQLDIFWETASTGYISDLNADVLTGFDGPVGFTSTNYTHFENQDGSGLSTVTGNANSKYITDTFYARDLQGSNLTNATMTLVNVVDLTTPPTNNRTSDFALESQGSGGYRLTIDPASEFVFNRDAATKENYIFTIEIVYSVAGIPQNPIQLLTTGRLGNITPEIIGGCSFYDTTITQSEAGVFTTIVAKNGAFLPTDSNTDLLYEIVSGNSGGYFQINSTNGEMSLTPPGSAGVIPIGFYSLDIKITDAFNVDEISPVNGGNFTSKSVECVTQNVGITVGQEKVPVGYRGIQGDILTGVLNFLGSAQPDRTGDPTNTTVNSYNQTGNLWMQQTGGSGSTGGAAETVSTKIGRPTYDRNGSATTMQNVKFACLYMGPHYVEIDDDFTDLNSTTYGSNTNAGIPTGLSLAALPTLNPITDDYFLGFGSADVFMAGQSLPKVNGETAAPVGLISGQLEVSNKLRGEGRWFAGSWLERAANNGQNNLYYKIFYRPATIDPSGTVNYADNVSPGWVQVSDMNGSVSSTTWSNAAGGVYTDSANNPLRTKVRISPTALNGSAPCFISGTCIGRAATIEDTFILDGTKNPGEYCIVYRFESGEGAAAVGGSESTGWASQPFYSTGSQDNGDIVIGTRDYNFEYTVDPAGVLRFAPGASTAAQYVINPSITTPSGAYSVGYTTQSQATSDVPFADNSYNSSTTFPLGSLNIILTNVTNPISPYLEISSGGIFALGTYIAAINVDGNPNKITISQPLAGTLSPSDVITIGRPSLSGPFDSTGVIVYSTQGSVNGVSQLFTNADCTDPYSVSSGDGSEDLFKLYNQYDDASNPAFIEYQNLTTGFNSNTSDGMPPLDYGTTPLNNGPLASAKINGNGTITTVSNSGDRGFSPMSQENTP